MTHDPGAPPLVPTALGTPRAALVAASFLDSLPQAAIQGAEFAKFNLIGSIRRFERNATIFHAGDEAQFFYKVISGSVRLIKMTGTGRRHIAGFQMAGDVFGVEWSSEHVLTAEAVSDTVVVCIARGRLESAGVDRAEIRTHLMTLLLCDLRTAQDRLLSLSCQTGKERVASFLLFLSGRVGAKDGEPIAMPMGREDVADYLGAAVETICRILHDLKTDGVIEIPNRAEIVICSGARLRAIAGANA